MGTNKMSFINEIYNDWRCLSRQKKWLFFLYTYLLVYYCRNFFYAIETRIGLSSYTDYSNAFFVILFLLGSFSVFIKKIRITNILFLLFVVLLYYLSINFNSNTSFLALDNFQNFIWLCLPMFLVGLTIDNKTPISLFVAMSYFALFLQILYLTVLGMGVDAEGNEINESMAESYAFLPFSCLLVYNAFKRGGLFHWTIAILSVFILLSLGTRGPVLCLAFFVSTYLIVFKHYKYKVFSIVLIGTITSIFYLYSREIVLGLGAISDYLGLSTRVFDSIVEDKMTNINESSYRDELWRNILEVLFDKKIFFDLNLFSDRLYNRINIDWYAHNLELELLCDFGLIGGGIVIILLFGFIFRAFKNVWNSELAVLLLVYFTSSIMHLQFSSSYLMIPIFWFFLGVCSSLISDNKQKVKL